MQRYLCLFLMIAALLLASCSPPPTLPAVEPTAIIPPLAEGTPGLDDDGSLLPETPLSPPADSATAVFVSPLEPVITELPGSETATPAAPQEGFGGGGEMVYYPLAVLADADTQLFFVIDPTGASEDIILEAPGLQAFALPYVTSEYIFYLNSDANHIERIDPFSDARAIFGNLPMPADFPSFFGSFLPSQNGEQLAVGFTDIIDEDAFDSVSQIYILDSAGNRELVYEWIVEGEQLLPTPIFWTADERYLYFTTVQYGIGGYILFWGGSGLYRLDLQTGQAVELLPDTRCLCAMGISPDGQLLAWIDSTQQPLRLTLQSLLTGETVFTHSIDPRATQAGAITWSPIGNALLYTWAIGDFDAEAYTIVQLEVSGNATLLTDNDPRLLRSSVWLTDTLIGYNDNLDYNAWLVDIRENIPTQISVRQFWIEPAIK